MENIFIPTKCVIRKNNEIIPMWDTRITIEEFEDYSTQTFFLGIETDLKDCYFNIQTKTLNLGIEYDLYPTEKDLTFKKGDVVLHNKSFKTMLKTKIIDIVFNTFELLIRKGDDLDEHYKKLLDINDNKLYSIKLWKPSYVLENGNVVNYDYQLYHFQE